MEAEPFQVLQSVNWNLRRTSGVSSSSKAGRFQTQEELIFQFSANTEGD
jgi:hypothetical protein